MGNHRAVRRGSGRRPSDLPTPVGGKRRAGKPARTSGSVHSEAVHSEAVLREDEATLVLPITLTDVAPAAVRDVSTYQSTRIGGVRTAAAPRTAPSKPGARRSASRAPLFRGLPSVPILLGVAALAVSAGGAVTAAGGIGSGDTPRFSQASALSGASSTSSARLLNRTVVSRGGALDRTDAANAQLKDQVEAQNQQRNSALQTIDQQAAHRSAKLALAWVTPIEPGVYHLTARFGDYSGLWANLHTGLDFACPTGTPIHAVTNGVITSTGYDGSYGNKTVETLEDGTELWYAHQTSFAVSPGDQVKVGDVIGYVGSTGNVTGPHVHLEVRPGGGDPVDPFAALVAHGVQP